MPARLPMARLARACAEHPWRVLGGWLAALVVAAVAATGLGDAFTSDATFTNRPESVQAEEALETRLRGPEPVTETVLIHSDRLTIDSPEFRAIVEQTAAALRGLPGAISSVVTYYELHDAGLPAAEELASADHHTTLLPVVFAGDADAAETHTAAYLDLIHEQGSTEISVATVGGLSIDEEFNTAAEEDLLRGELVGLIAALVILVAVFGALVAAGIPLALAIAAIALALGATALVGRAMDLSFFVVNMITMIGLAVGIDYALFIIERYREERRLGANTLDAIEIAGSTASKAVVFSGVTVVLALLGLFMIPTVVFRSLGAGAVLVVIAAILATLTLVPAMLGLLGDRIEWPRRPKRDHSAIGSPADGAGSGFWNRITRLVTARPALSAAAAALLLAALALPYFDLERGQSGVESLPPSDVRSAYAALATDFPRGLLSPVEVVIDAPRTAETEAAIVAFGATLANDPVFGAPEAAIWNDANDLALVSIPLTVDSSSPEALATVSLLRDELLPAAFPGQRVLVGGAPAESLDFNATVDAWTPVVFAFVLGLSFVLLTLAFRSIVVPVMAIAMNLLSVGAAYGSLVLVFQKGVATDLLGLQRTPAIETWVPIFLFCVLFGLSMDYHVFLLSRIREHFDRTGRNDESVALGLQQTGKIITGAALIMVAVFGGFAAGQLVMFQQVGFGLAIAVILDATVVRSVLAPASMALLGDRNWFLPSWLAWLPDLRVEGSPRELDSAIGAVAAD